MLYSPVTFCLISSLSSFSFLTASLQTLGAPGKAMMMMLMLSLLPLCRQVSITSLAMDSRSDWTFIRAETNWGMKKVRLLLTKVQCHVLLYDDWLG